MGRLEKIPGTEIVDDIRLGHTFHEVSALIGVIQHVNPDWFVEVGVHEGGLSYVLLPLLKDTTHYLGIELDCGLVRPQVKDLYLRMNAQLLCADCFDPNTLSLVSSLPGIKIIYCDGGNKRQELIIYSKLLRHYDWILSHDYWDRVRELIDVPSTYPAEVLPEDVEFLRNKDYVERELPGTRIVAFMKI